VATVGVLLVLYAVYIRVPNAPHLQDEAEQTTAKPALAKRNLEGFDSPYLGHTGSWDGQGGGMFGASKIPDLDREAEMGLRWTFMCAYWRKMEPEAPADLSGQLPAAWQEMDGFVIAAHDRRLNILMQAPVMGGNAGGPPLWAGKREQKSWSSAPADMNAAAAFAGKLVERYRPGGVLAVREGWGESYGILAWELDNEPDSYLTNWGGEAGDYAEFVSKVATRIKEVDSQALVLTPALGSGANARRWLEEALGLHGLAGSPVYVAQGKPHSIGPWTDVVTFHIYEGMDTVLSHEDHTVDWAMRNVRAPFKAWQQQSGAGTPREFPCWHTEGNFDFFGVTSQELRAAWRFQFFTRGFAAGVAKICVMDASEKEQMAVREYIRTLPNPFPMLPASKEVEAFKGSVQAFRHPDGARPDDGQVWVIWADNGTDGADMAVSVVRDRVRIHHVDGSSEDVAAVSGKIRLSLPGGKKISPPVLLEDRA
jgi:hypothetical protein